MLALGIVLAAADLLLWRVVVRYCGYDFAGDPICTDCVATSGRRYGEPFWNGTVTAARSLSSISRSVARRGLCTFMRSTTLLTRTICRTTRRLALPIIAAGTRCAGHASCSRRRLTS